MRVFIQRVKKASVTVEQETVSQIGKGLLLLVGIGKGDTREDIDYLSLKISNLRIFEDENKKMNVNIKQAGGSILSVSQFTLYADTAKGNRPGFDQAASPETAEELWKLLNDALRARGIQVKEGMFAAHMDVGLINDGPVSIWLESKNR